MVTDGQRGNPRIRIGDLVITISLWKLLKAREVESGLGEEALEEAGLVLHPPGPGLDQRGQLTDVLLDQVGQRPFQVRPCRLAWVQLRRRGAGGDAGPAARPGDPG
jgi:hypothetical protein